MGNFLQTCFAQYNTTLTEWMITITRYHSMKQKYHTAKVYPLIVVCLINLSAYTNILTAHLASIPNNGYFCLHYYNVVKESPTIPYTGSLMLIMSTLSLRSVYYLPVMGQFRLTSCPCACMQHTITTDVSKARVSFDIVDLLARRGRFFGEREQ